MQHFLAGALARRGKMEAAIAAASGRDHLADQVERHLQLYWTRHAQRPAPGQGKQSKP
jgi:hypothetical protein